MQPSATHSIRTTARDPRWDNLRFLAGTLVLLIHVTETLPEQDGLHWLYLATWGMRLPLFALLAGYFSSAAALREGRAWQLAVSLLVPFAAVDLLAAAEIWAMSAGEPRWSLEVHSTAWTLWFLQALFLWRLTLPLLARLRYPLATSVIASLLAGYLPLDGLPFAFSRTVGMLPFFLLGWKLRQGALAPALRAGWSRGAAVAVLAATFATAWLVRGHAERDLLLFRYTYAELGVPFAPPLDWTIRCAALLGGMAVAISLIRLFPAHRVPFLTYLGSGGLYIYLLHGLVLRPLNAAEAFSWVDSRPDQALLVALCVTLSAGLASPPVRRLCRHFVQPRLPVPALFTPSPTGPTRHLGSR